MALNKVNHHLVNRNLLDADTLDGKSSEAFAPVHTHPYLANTLDCQHFTSVGNKVKYKGSDVSAASADNATTWAGLKHWIGTQTQYNALGSYDSNTLYLVRKG